MGFEEGYGSIRAKRMEKDADAGIRASASQMGDRQSETSRTGLDWGGGRS